MPNTTQISGKKVLVTGGAGFIGSHLCKSLIDSGNTVVCLDNLSTGFKINVQPLLSKSGFTFIEGDICDLDTCLLACQGMDIVLHQAALGSVPRSIENPPATVETNIQGFVNILWAAVQCGVKRFVYAASSSTYGDSKELPKIEENIGKALSPYAITKYANELFANNFAELYGIEVVGLRYFNVFGPRQNPDGAYAAVIPKFILQILGGKAPVINGDGKFSRDFTYVDNVVKINHLAATTDSKEALNTVYNVACGEQTDLNSMFSSLREYLSEIKPSCMAIEPIYGPERSGDIPHSLADTSKARRLLGYTPLVNVQDGLKKTCQWFASK
jgi:UDP-N-acetylglucosamine/UDP-N-acetylgalactosamine 4-epimerase